MAVAFEDYYKILGVGRDASQQDIQRAFRKLARQYHPDINKAEDAQAKFAKINEAYEVLKDPEKRRKYDELGANWKAGQEFRPPPGWEKTHFEFGGPGGGGFSPGGFSDFFEMFFGSRGGRAGGSVRFEDLFDQAARGSSAGGGGFQQAAPEQEASIAITLQEAYHGTTRRLNLQGPTGQKTVEVKIPAGATDGSKIRLRGENLILRVSVSPHPDFQLSGHDLTTTVKVSPWEAALGSKVDVPTLEGTITLTIPAGSQSGQKLRLRGKGMPRGKSDHRGDLFVKLMIAVPKHLSDEERKLYEQLKAQSEFDPRAK